MLLCDNQRLPKRIKSLAIFGKKLVGRIRLQSSNKSRSISPDHCVAQCGPEDINLSIQRLCPCCDRPTEHVAVTREVLGPNIQTQEGYKRQ